MTVIGILLKRISILYSKCRNQMVHDIMPLGKKGILWIISIRFVFKALAITNIPEFLRDQE